MDERTKQILKEGKVEIRVQRGGMWQRLTFVVKKVKIPSGEYPLLYTDRTINIAELSRIAEEYKLPVACPTATAFPKGKRAEDFLL